MRFLFVLLAFCTEAYAFEAVDADRSDRHYPKEERRERSSLVFPTLEAIQADAAVLSIDGETNRLRIGETLNHWMLIETLEKPRPVAVLLRRFDHWGLFVFLSKEGPVAELRTPIGRIECIREPEVRFPDGYFAKLIESQRDVLGDRVLAERGEASFENVLGFLAPLEAYTFLGSRESEMKWIVQPSGAIGKFPNKWGGNKPLEKTVLDPRALLARQPGKEKSDKTAAPPETVFQAKRGLIGGHLPAIHFGFYDAKAASGLDWAAMMEPGKSGVTYTRLCNASGDVLYHRIEPNGNTKRLDDGKAFFTALVESHLQWKEFFATGMQLEVNDSRVEDEVRASIVRAMCGYVDLHPKYGMGYYWGATDMHDGFPPTTLSLCTTLLAWGHDDEAKRYLGYYLDHFVKPDGTLRYYGPAVAEYGELLELAVAVARQSGDTAWFDDHRDALERMLAYLLRLRKKSLDEVAPDEIAHGLLYGGAEADTRKETDYYLSGSAWCRRGLLEMGRYYRTVGTARKDAAMVETAEEWLAEAKRLREDVLVAVRRSTIRTGQETFVPPIAGFDKPFVRMTQDRLANYTNYRYWPETLYAGCLTPEAERSILDYRANHGGDLLGMTRFGKREQHFDDWPFYQHAYGLLANDRVSQYILGYFGHMAHHQTPGTMTSYEQVDLLGQPRRHDYADYCVPAQLTLPLLTRWMLVFEERDADVLWLLRATPRAWLEDRLAFRGAPTRWGAVGLSLEADEGRDVYTAKIDLAREDFSEIRLRLRHPDGRRLKAADVEGGDCMEIASDGQTISIRPARKNVVVTARFRPSE